MKRFVALAVVLITVFTSTVAFAVAPDKQKKAASTPSTIGPSITSFLELYASRVQKYSDTHPGQELKPNIYPIQSIMPGLTGITFSAGNVMIDFNTCMVTSVDLLIERLGRNDEDYMNRFNLAIMAYSAIEYDATDESLLESMYKAGLGEYKDVYTACLPTFLDVISALNEATLTKLLRGQTVFFKDGKVASWSFKPVNAYDSNGNQIDAAVDIYLHGEIK